MTLFYVFRIPIAIFSVNRPMSELAHPVDHITT